MKMFVLALGFFSSLACAASLETHMVQTPRGEMVPLDLHLPEASGKVPLLIMAPGGNYHRQLAIFSIAAEKAVSAGFAVLRMDWAYCKLSTETKRCTSRASSDLSAELEDLTSVVEFAKRHARIDADKIVLSGKSLGTLVSYQAFQKNPDSFRALALLTPLFTGVNDQGQRYNAGSESYPGLEEFNKPLLLLLGNQDPATDLKHLWESLATLPGTNVTVAVVGGDHSMMLNTNLSSDVEPNVSNLNLAIDNLVAWMKRELADSAQN